MNTTDYAQISSSNIRFLLTKNNMSIRQLAEKIGIAATTLNDSLKSKKGVSVDSLIKIAIILILPLTTFAMFHLTENQHRMKRSMI